MNDEADEYKIDLPDEDVPQDQKNYVMLENMARELNGLKKQQSKHQKELENLKDGLRNIRDLVDTNGLYDQVEKHHKLLEKHADRIEKVDRFVTLSLKLLNKSGDVVEYVLKGALLAAVILLLKIYLLPLFPSDLIPLL